MATAYTSLLGLALPVTGELSGTWGSTVNAEITALLDSAIAGTTTLSTDADVTLTTTTGAANTSRQAILLCSGARTVLRTITAPAQSKIYTVINATTGGFSVKLVGAGPTTGVTIVAGESAVCAWNGSDFVKVANQNGIGNFTTLNATTVDSTNLEVTNLKAKDGTAAGSIADSTGVVTLASSVLTTTDINGGTIDGTAIGGSTAAAGAFTTLSASSTATFAAGTAAAPSITTTGDTNTGIFFPAADTIAFSEGGAEAMRIDSSGNVGIGTASPAVKLHVSGNVRGTAFYVDGGAYLSSAGSDSLTFIAGSSERARIDSSGNVGIGTSSIQKKLTIYANQNGIRLGHDFTTADYSEISFSSVGVAGNGAAIRSHRVNENFDGNEGDLRFFTNAGGGGASDNGAERARIDSSGNLLVGTTARFSTERVSINQTVVGAQALYTKNLSNDFNFNCWNADTLGNNQFVQFITETSPTSRGAIIYNRAGGLVAYNTTSDYRAKDITGYVTDSGALIDSVPVYMGKMKGATQERPMFIAHETPAYAHTGVKDAVDKDGKPVYQQMDASALIPVMWAEIQSLRARLKAANI